MKNSGVTGRAWSSWRRIAPWLLIGLVVVILALRHNPLRAAVGRNIGYLALNQSLATADNTSASSTVGRARGVAALRRATERQPANTSNWRALGYLYLLNGDEGSAVAAWQQAGNMLPELLFKAQHADQVGRSDEAHEWYRRLPLVAPDDPAAWLELGMFYERAGDWTAAVAAHESGVLQAAANSDLFFHLALAQRRAEPPDWATILDLSDRALATDAFLHDWSRWRSHHLRAEALRALGRPAEARDEFALVVAEQPDNYWAIVNLAQLLWQVDGDSVAAEKLYRTALGLEPDNKWGYLFLAELFAAQGQNEQARPLFERVLELDPTDVAANDWLAQQ